MGIFIGASNPYQVKRCGLKLAFLLPYLWLESGRNVTEKKKCLTPC